MHVFLLLHDSIQGSKIILKSFATILSNNPITFIHCHKTRSIFARVALVVVIEPQIINSKWLVHKPQQDFIQVALSRQHMYIQHFSLFSLIQWLHILKFCKRFWNIFPKAELYYSQSGIEAQYFYPVEPLYEASHNTSQLFCFRTQCLKNKTIEMSYMNPRTKVQLCRKIGLDSKISSKAFYTLTLYQDTQCKNGRVLIYVIGVLISEFSP